MAKKYSIAEARDNLPGVIHEVEAGTRVELTRRGKPVAVVLGISEYERLAEGRRDFWQAYEELRREFHLDALEIDPDEVFEGVRDPSPGREHSW
jgi:prevent-host-death family protein